MTISALHKKLNFATSMTPKRFHILFFLLTALLSASPSQAQETLKASRIEAKGARRYLPSLGLPRRADGGIDRLIRYDIPIWTGREDVKATPNWNMCELRPGSMIPAGVPGEVAEICLQWLSESPKGRLSIVFGPLWRGTYEEGYSSIPHAGNDVVSHRLRTAVTTGTVSSSGS